MDKEVFLDNDVTTYGQALFAIEGRIDFDLSDGRRRALSISEPFDLTNTARSVYDEDEFERIIRVFRRSYFTIDKSRSFASLLIEPFE